MADQIGLQGRANNLFELGLHSQLQSSQVTLSGDLLEKIKNDPAMVKFQNDIIKMLKADPRFKKLGFVLADRKVIEFGGKRAQVIWLHNLKILLILNMQIHGK